MQDYRIVVVGAGPGGYMAAIRAAQLGQKTAVVERDRVGGACLNWGCIPTKSLRASAQVMGELARAASLGLEPGGAFKADWPAMVTRARGVVDTLTGGVAGLLKAHGVELISGAARLEPSGGMAVEGPEGSRVLNAARLILATGSRPAVLPGLEPDGEMILDSDQVLSLPELPAYLAIIGGGVIGVEYASIFARLGVKVTLIEAAASILPLPSLDPPLVKLLARELKKARIVQKTAKVVKDLRREGDGLVLTLGPSPLVPDAPAGEEELRADRVLVAVGRRVNSAGLGLAEAGVETGPGGAIKVNELLETTRPGVYAVGDVLGPSRPMLAHLAGYEGKKAAANAAGEREAADYGAVPAVVFTNPEAAWVGLSLAQARERGLEAAATDFPLRILGATQAWGELAGECRLVHEAGGRILGAQISGQHAGDMIHTITLALRLGARVEDLAETIFAHPTFSEALGEAAEAALGRCLHLPPVR